MKLLSRNFKLNSKAYVSLWHPFDKITHINLFPLLHVAHHITQGSHLLCHLAPTHLSC